MKTAPKKWKQPSSKPLKSLGQMETKSGNGEAPLFPLFPLFPENGNNGNGQSVTLCYQTVKGGTKMETAPSKREHLSALSLVVSTFLIPRERHFGNKNSDWPIYPRQDRATYCSTDTVTFPGKASKALSVAPCEMRKRPLKGVSDWYCELAPSTTADPSNPLFINEETRNRDGNKRKSGYGQLRNPTTAKENPAS